MCPIFCYCSCCCDLFPDVCPWHVVANPLCLCYFVCVSNISVFVLLSVQPISLYLSYFMWGQFLHICPPLCEASFSYFLCGQFSILVLIFAQPIFSYLFYSVCGRFLHMYLSYFWAVNFFIFVLCVANISIFYAICVANISIFLCYMCGQYLPLYAICVANISIYMLYVWSILHVVPLHAVTYRASCPTTQCMVLYY